MGASTSLEIGKVPGNETKCKIKYCKKVPLVNPSSSSFFGCSSVDDSCSFGCASRGQGWLGQGSILRGLQIR
jgi:hypothetical protein